MQSFLQDGQPHDLEDKVLDHEAPCMLQSPKAPRLQILQARIAASGSPSCQVLPQTSRIFRP